MSKENKVTMIMKILLSPIRILDKASKLYTKSMMGCAGRFGYVAGPEAAMGYNLQRSYTISSCRLREREDEYKELLMGLERKRNDMNMDMSWGPSTRGRVLNGVGIRSYSVVVGKIGKIDEERPCSFREDDVVLKSRCRSCWAYHPYLDQSPCVGLMGHFLFLSCWWQWLPHHGPWWTSYNL